MSLSNNKILGVKSKVKNIRRRVIDENITTAIYKRSEIKIVAMSCLYFQGWISIRIQTYDEGVAYRFVVTENKPFKCNS